MAAENQNPRWLTRRRFLWTTAGAAAVAAAGAGTYQGATPWLVRRWAMDIVRDNLTGATLDEASLRQFADDALRNRELLQPKRRQILVWAACTLPALVSRVGGASRPLEILERRVLSEFMIASNFFATLENRAEPVVYTGRVAACGNIFARYRDT
ncbi:MAG TPA: twin-arginine translocation signal domain-containing protein [Opitutaceae bacterium]